MHMIIHKANTKAIEQKLKKLNILKQIINQFLRTREIKKKCKEMGEVVMTQGSFGVREKYFYVDCGDSCKLLGL